MRETLTDGTISIQIQVNGKDVERANKGLLDMEGGAKRAEGGLKGMAGAASNAVKKIGEFALQAGVFKLLNGAINMVKNSLDSAFGRIDTMEQFDRVMTTITGSSEEAARALEATNESVLGTAYGLDVAAQAVQNFVTRGMEVDKATDTIAAWGDAVAFYGDGSNAQLSSVSDALSKMVTKGSVEMDQMNRLFDAGIPAVDIYADKVGMSTEEVQSQLSSGEISAEQFVSTMNKAFMEGTEGFASIEGAAKDAGATWGATFDNMNAAVARGVISIIESIDELLEDNGLLTMREMVSEFGSQFESVLKSAAGAITEFGQPFIDVITNIVNLFSGDANGLQGALESLVPRMVEWIQQELPQLLESGLEMVRHIAVGISESSIGLKESALELLGAFVEGVMEALPMILETGFQVVGTLLSSFYEKYPDILQMGADIILTIVEGVLESLPAIIESGIMLIDTLIEGIIMNFPVINETVLNIITTFLDIVIENLPLIIDAGIDLLFALIDGIMEVMPEVGEAAIEIVDTFLKYITDNLPEIVEKGTELLIKLVEGISDRLPEIATIAVEIILSFINTIIENLPEVIGAGVEILLSLVEGIIKSFFELDSAITESVNIILDGFNEISLFDIGVALIQGLWNGISSMGGWLWEKVSGFAGDIVGWVKGRLGVESPSKVFRDEIGKMIPAGMEIGIRAGEIDVKRATDDLVDASLSVDTIGNIQHEIQGLVQNTLLQLSPALSTSYTSNYYNNRYESNSGSQKETIDYKELGRSLVSALAGMHVNLDGDKTVGELSPKIAKQLHENVNKKGRRYGF